MRIPAFCMAILAYVVIGHAPPALAQVDQQRAQEYFKEVQALCERDGGRLWGVSLCRPMVIGACGRKRWPLVSRRRKGRGRRWSAL